MSRAYIAFDIGASNGRSVIGRFDGEHLTIEIANRFKNGYVKVNKHLYWNILGIFQNMKLSLRQAGVELGGDIASIGIDTWGVDFGLLDQKGDLIGNPFCYRDPHTTSMMAEVFERISRAVIYQTTGIQFMAINSLYQLYAMRKADSPALNCAETFLMIPDLLNYWLTGHKVCEYTNATTTQVLDAKTKNWAMPIIKALGIPGHIFPEIIEPGQIIGQLMDSICTETGVRGAPIIAVGSHDTASAVASVPASKERFAYISSGTWGLLGGEVSGPVLNPKALIYNFANEGGVFNTIRLLKNIVNMWFVQECERVWAHKGEKYSWAELIRFAGQARPFTAFIDPDAPEFTLPDHMPAAIQAYCKRTEQEIPQTKGEIIRTVLESLAMKYRYNLKRLEDLLGEPIERFHIVGGATQNKLLSQFAANAIQCPVEAGPTEATALGNLILQMIAIGDLSNLREGRELIKASFPTEIYMPKEADTWDEYYEVFINKTGLASE